MTVSIFSKYSTIGQSPSIRENVFHTIRNLILYDQLKQGEKLVEAQMAEYLGVSRTPVREALQRLEQEGLIQFYPRRYYVVRGISVEDAVEIIEIRAVLESMAVEKACATIDDKILEVLEQLLSKSRLYYESGETEKMGDTDDEFHQTIISHAGCKRLSNMLCNYYDYIMRFRKISLSNPKRSEIVQEEHRLIFAALERRDPQETASIMKAHIMGSIPFINQELKK